MNQKVLLILADGMRPDSIRGIPFVEDLLKRSAYTMHAQTVFPSITLPCHMSLFHSVDPQRHGISTNTYTPQVRPINGLCEQLALAGKSSAFFYDWQELRDLVRPGSLDIGFYYRGYQPGTSELLAGEAIRYLTGERPDFIFLYFGLPDHIGHSCRSGWMGPEYLQAVRTVWEQIERVMDAAGDGYTVIITADHGGHDRVHGTDLPEDMTIPVICRGQAFQPGEISREVNIMDLAPTIVKLVGAAPAAEWEGIPLV